MIKHILSVVIFAVMMSSSVGFAGTIEISPANASVFFRVTHDLGYTIGSFNDFSGSVELDEAGAKLLSTKIQVETASVDTRSPVRDEGLRSALFLDVAKFPQASYDNGALTIKGIAKPLAWDMEAVKDKMIVLKGTLNRNDYGITYNKLLPKKKKSIGDTVELIVEINPAVSAK